MLSHHKIIELLAQYRPVLAGTFPLDIAVPGSDLDVLCYWQEAGHFKQHVTNSFSGFENFTLREVTINNQHTIITNFFADGLEVEVFGQNIPVKQQMAYRHMIIEYKILSKKGDNFRQQVIALKQSGLKTEPAFAQLLGIEGNPYTALLEFNV
ncbi:DUF4269 domain-containing protein [Flavobacterium subsaxonicum]|uniref:DUF4269 domain-containing protein n=1 Tax=Flavobacterium subsaxonicum TaxID=426226 RepID=UPI0021CD49CF|nr:DUF4269 domain-containing protein [Flavobacterium subsaxonicum]